MDTFSAVPGEFPTKRSVTRSFDIFFDLRLNKRLSKQWWGWLFETPSRPLWRQCNANVVLAYLGWGHKQTFSNTSSCMERVVSWFKFSWKAFPWLRICQHWSRLFMDAKQAPGYDLNWCVIYPYLEHCCLSAGTKISTWSTTRLKLDTQQSVKTKTNRTYHDMFLSKSDDQ